MLAIANVIDYQYQIITQRCFAWIDFSLKEKQNSSFTWSLVLYSAILVARRCSFFNPLLMAWFNRPLRFPIVTTILAVVFTLGLAVNLSAQVPSAVYRSSISNQLPNQWEFRAPRGPGAPLPDNRQGGATRGGECIQDEAELTALVPASGIGLTANEYPTIYWFMPKSSASEVEFVLRDATAREIYSMKYALTKSSQGVVIGTPSIMSLSVPALASFSPLEIGQEYRWLLALICNPIDRSSDSTIEGRIKRTPLDPTLLQKVQQVTPQERIALYAQSRLWYETVGTMVELQRVQPNDYELKQAWRKLLNSVELDTTFKRRALKR